MNSRRLSTLFMEIDRRYYKSGELYKNKYVGQYHIGAYILSLVHFLNWENKYHSALDSVKKLLLFQDEQFGSAQGRINADFSLESICLAHFCTKDLSLKNT